MISHEGEVKLIDFGLAVSSQKLEHTAPQVVMGKMAYMAPEQARGEAVDARVDQFAVGIMLYELLTNTHYYGDLSVEAMWRMSGVGGHRPAPLPALDDDLREIVLPATAPRRDDRYPTCADMRDALTAAELRRGTIAGSREVRAALLALDGRAPVSAPIVAAPAVAAAPPEPTDTSSKAPARLGDLEVPTPTSATVTTAFVEANRHGADDGDDEVDAVAIDGPTLRRVAPPAPRPAEATVTVRLTVAPPAASPPPRARLWVAAVLGAGALVTGIAIRS